MNSNEALFALKALPRCPCADFNAAIIASREQCLGTAMPALHGYSDGKRISLAIKDLPHMTISYDLESQEGFPLPELHRFDDIYGELHYVCNRIARMANSTKSIRDYALISWWGIPRPSRAATP